MYGISQEASEILPTNGKLQFLYNVDYLKTLLIRILIPILILIPANNTYDNEDDDNDSDSNTTITDDNNNDNDSNDNSTGSEILPTNGKLQFLYNVDYLKTLLIRILIPILILIPANNTYDNKDDDNDSDSNTTTTDDNNNDNDSNDNSTGSEILPTNGKLQFLYNGDYLKTLLIRILIPILILIPANNTYDNKDDDNDSDSSTTTTDDNNNDNDSNDNSNINNNNNKNILTTVMVDLNKTNDPAMPLALPSTVTSQWAPWRLKSPASPLFAQHFVQVHII